MPAALAADLSCANCDRVMRRFSITLRRWFFGRGCLPMGLVSYNKTLVRVNSTALLARIGVSFWTVGQTLTMTSVGADHRAYQMVMTKGDPRYIVRPRRSLFGEEGTEIKIGPLQNGIRTLTGEKIQWYLASELRDRIRNTQVRVTVIDKLARKQCEVELDSLRAACCTNCLRFAHGSERHMLNCISRLRPKTRAWPSLRAARA